MSKASAKTNKGESRSRYRQFVRGLLGIKARRVGSRGRRDCHCVHFAPGRLSLRRVPSPAFLTVLAPLLPRGGSQLDLVEGMETGESLSSSSPARSTARSLGSEARSAVSSPRGVGSALLLSTSEEVDVESVDSPPQSPQYEELLEVVTRAVTKLNIDWPAEKQAELQKSKLNDAFCVLSRYLHAGGLPFFSRSLHRGVEIVEETILGPLIHPQL